MAHLLPKEPTVQRVKVAQLGDDCTGKTSLLTRFHSGKYQSSYNMTLGCNVLISTIRVPDTDYTVELHIVDMGGHSLFYEQRKLTLPSINTFIGMYDVTNESSLTSVSQYIDDVLQWTNKNGKNSNIIGALVGTKMDLINDTNTVISDEVVNLTAKALNFESFKTSAKEGTNVDEPFLYIAKQTIQNYEDIQTKLKAMS